tara:strand:+ start:3066 stop:3911 length:846 start_codon:yes stop_codon:yes gene_type:complete
MIYISTTFTKDNSSIKKSLSKLKKFKINNVELGSNHKYEKNYNFIKKNEFNYLVHNYFPVPKKNIIINIASQIKKIRQESIKQVKKSINFSKKIGAKLYTFHPGFLTDPDGTNQSDKNYDFLWQKDLSNNKNYEHAWKNMTISLKEIILFAKKKGVKIAIETEGSINASEHLLMQRPSEFLKFKKIFSKNDIGINLNIGHLNLASKVFNFDKIKFVKQIENYIVAMELSHNSGKNDDHLPLKKNEWYWKIINNKKFKLTPKILEFRNTSIDKIYKQLRFFT